MATIAAGAILTRIREVLQDGEGAVRALASGAYAGGLYESIAENAEAVRALTGPRIGVRFTGLERHPASPPRMGSVQLLALEVEVTVARHFGAAEALDDTARDALQALAMADGDALQQALGWPGNMTATTGGAATGLVSGCLTYEGSDEGEIRYGQEGQDGVIRTTHSFSGICRVETATS